jgi:NAD+ kinase
MSGKKIGIIFQPKIEAAQNLAAETAAELERAGNTVWVSSAWSRSEVSAHLDSSDLLVAFGGDGTVLRAARICAVPGIPILSVNFGRLGFIVEIEPGEIRERMADYFSGKYWIEERIMLSATVRPAENRLEAQLNETYTRTFLAFNDVVVSRGGAARLIQLITTLNGDPFTTFIADGAIVATPTGSTAYSLAAGGPILDSSLSTILLTPIAPHLGLRQSLVLPDNYRVEFEVRSDHGAVISVDGQLDLPLIDGDTVQVVQADVRAKLVRFHEPTHFYQTLAERLTRRLVSGNR